MLNQDTSMYFCLNNSVCCQIFTPRKGSFGRTELTEQCSWWCLGFFLNLSLCFCLCALEQWENNFFKFRCKASQFWKKKLNFRHCVYSLSLSYIMNKSDGTFLVTVAILAKLNSWFAKLITQECIQDGRESLNRESPDIMTTVLCGVCSLHGSWEVMDLSVQMLSSVLDLHVRCIHQFW